MKIINFASIHPNIGNYTPLWGIKKISPFSITETIDCRNYSKINIKDYELAIVGGAGLLHICFEDFWRWITKQKIPIIIWGVGACWNKKVKSNVDPNILNSAGNILAANVRDKATAFEYDFPNCHVSFCPTAVYFKNFSETKGNKLLYVHHNKVDDNIKKFFVKKCNTYTSNFSKNKNFSSIIKKYKRANVIITTRLHGAIIANSLGKPYIAYSEDLKIEEYHRMYGGGIVLKDYKDYNKEILNSVKNVKINIDYKNIYKFAHMAKDIIDTSL